ncbi:c-type cytochrome [Halovulum dunhuangense]|uniref:C-type cytochrome n=1 Tax=Halovulum dunhuangense TaxID=1505036 RepID=A0A849L4Z2_9RHOB|nr:cytochrome c [Halovulum dunhuangense]NNU81211.1 c-type cytochrome [Halovulum dunhuangense]
MRLLTGIAALALVGAAAGYVLTRPLTVASGDIPDHGPDLENGALLFAAGGCASCHAAPGAEGDATLVLAGGQRIESDFGVFVVPNISSDPEAGIGGWTEAEFLSAMLHGTSPEGSHYYPAFPYTSYARMDPTDVLDLLAYLRTLPASDNVAPDHELGFPYNIRAGIGLWKARYLDPSPVMPVPDDPLVARGQALVEGIAHCGECHTPRDSFGGLDRSAWLAGAPNPNGPGNIPNITPHGDALTWSEGDIAYYLETGFTPDFDSVGGSMVPVVENLAKLPPEDRQAIAAYLKAVPPVPPADG